MQHGVLQRLPAGLCLAAGLVPVALAALQRLIELNGVNIEENQRALAGVGWPPRTATMSYEPRAWPPRLCHKDAGRVDRAPQWPAGGLPERGLRAAVPGCHRSGQELEGAVCPGSTDLTEAVARYLYKLMAYKDEYEVARLYTDGAFLQKLGETFEGDFH